ncbi:MAG TPA: hypothetical protein VFR81_13980 [Longimicrobium sp.]|nr:hypothetical protein [Longimicrobium sp.]
MQDERRYREDEVAAIFEAAASRGGSGSSALTSGEGLTLAELQTIGSEVGMAPARIAEAAAALDLRRSTLRLTDLGMPVSVRRAVDLPRPPTDREWEMLVAEMRGTFNAKGRDGSRGSMREWSNGNLHALVEPTGTGHRLRLGTTKGDAVPLNRMGATGLVMALVSLLALFFTGELPDGLFLPLVFAAMGGGTLAYNALRLPAWAREREEQMELVAAQARLLLAGNADPEPEAPPSRELPAGG